MVFISLLVIFHLINSKIIVQHYTYTLERPAITLDFNRENTNIVALINTFHPFSLIRRKAFTSTVDDGFLGSKTFYFDSEMPVTEYRTDVTFEDYLLPGYHVYLYNMFSWYPDQGIGLGYKFEDDRYSLVHLLYNNKLIEHKMYALFFNDDKKEGTISFGGIPNNEHLQYTFHGYCNAVEEYTSWGCNMTSIAFDNKSQRFSYYAALSNGLYGIYSKKLFDFFVNNIIQNEIKADICSIHEDETEYRKYVKCNKEIEKINKNVTITFGNMILKLKLIDLFEKNQNLYDSLVSNNNFHFYNKYDVLFGIKFFTFFKYLVFNYDDKRIEFYSNDISITMIQSEYFVITKTLYIIINVLCLIMISTLLIITKEININNIK